ncbi:LuxR C-terminal-related transcriptional regulator [Sinomonas sp. ASV486]|uniref:LuxR C-terminal-related transcriptional regulator n=1 Tax=Sinomonas sp. ASV486 TaxID=3051170 RepID=UPI0027DE00D8|nr:LuxR C-terminal-related transcriptional regulator [Sinomonas sp. ASV486]MDQ4490085.1 LuxR C-terminal-related transcriptional regulator [Sinomonas sp. ASV486]
MSTAALVGRMSGGQGLTSFVGRRRELAEMRELMSRSRLLTLVGPGGVGKTRLAVELVARSGESFRDGTWLVELAALEDGDLVGSQVAAALRLPDQSNRSALDRLADYLRERELLIVVDNCEHLLDAVAPLASELLEVAPGLRILATSREPLGIPGEQVYSVPPLPAPAESQPGADPLEGFESVRLLVDRARSVDPTFEITDANRHAVAQLCQRLDGMPLAIELAASRLRSLSVIQLVERLDRRFDLLTGNSRVAVPRQQTLRALVDWSYELCSPAERLLWARLAAFPGGFDLEAAEDVCGFGEVTREDVLDLLDRLVSKSLVLAERLEGPRELGGGRVRYRQLMTFREYGAELLDAAGEASQLRRRQRDHFLARAARMVSSWCGPDQAERLAAARRDHANLLSALDWSASTPGEELAGMRLAALLRYHWHAGGNLSDGRRWLDRFLALSSEPTPERGDALWAAAWVCLVQGDRGLARSYLQECRRVARLLNDPVLAAHADHWDALRELFGGNLEPALAMFDAAIAVHRRVGDTMSALIALFQRSWAQTYAGRPREGLAACQEAIRESEELGERWTQAYSHWVSGLCQRDLGDLDAARQCQIAALEIQQGFLDGICIALTIDETSWTTASTGRYEDAAVLFHTAQSVWKGLGTAISAFGPHLQADSERAASLIRRGLGGPRFEAILALPPVPTKERAIELALATARSGPPAPEAATTPRPERDTTGPKLTKREHQIAALVAEGRSNKEIAAALVVSPRTVDGHVENILAKLGFTSRVQIAAWIAGHTGPERTATSR